MLTTENKQRLVAGGVFALPIVLVKATTIMLGGSGPLQASAAPQPERPFSQERDPTWRTTDPAVEGAAVAHIAWLRDQAFGPTPFHYESRRKPSRTQIQVGPGFVVQAIMVTPGGNVAVIDPGPALDAHVDAVAEALGGDTVTHILITHTHIDHSPASRPLQARVDSGNLLPIQTVYTQHYR